MTTVRRRRRTLMSMSVALLAFAVTACGEGDDVPQGARVDGEWAYAHGATDVVLDYNSVGGLRMRGFPSTTIMRVMGDGTTLINPHGGADFDTFYVLHAARSDLQGMFADAHQAHLLNTGRDYAMPEGHYVDDAGFSVITIRGGEAGQLVYQHSAEALGNDGTETSARDDLAGFVDDLESRFEVPAGPWAEVFEPDQVALLIYDIDEVGAFGQDAEDVVPWPGSPLPQEDECQVMNATPEVLAALQEMDWSTRFRVGGKVYELGARPVLPGDGDVCEGVGRP